ncbi:flagellar protein FlaG [Eubacterium oxidoreducens]|uniref:Flagellar protein FlaG n=1 Tax=Eubacterium oxidoreducens TaxID=1732 RepID=A0A1G6BRS9_EUBOX|nr:flagellar protein FlaG [Eubacterium oxidoreducens]SDB23349.1 flagellar protein FlaG [Eubacterium oxidoreducens]
MGIDSINSTTATASYTEPAQSAPVSRPATTKSVSTNIPAPSSNAGSHNGTRNTTNADFSTKNAKDMAATIAPSQEDSKERVEAQNESIKSAVDTINKASNTEAIFGIHDKTNRVTIKIVDKESKEVIKELPPEKTLDMIAKVWEMAGLFVDEKR